MSSPDLAERRPQGRIEDGVYTPHGMTRNDVIGSLPSPRPRIEEGYFIPPGMTLEDVKGSFFDAVPQAEQPDLPNSKPEATAEQAALSECCVPERSRTSIVPLGRVCSIR